MAGIKPNQSVSGYIKVHKKSRHQTVAPYHPGGRHAWQLSPIKLNQAFEKISNQPIIIG
jgi:hypothetical protein